MTSSCSESSATSEFPALPGIDIAAGLHRMMNKPALYERVLRDFGQRFANEGAVIRAALAAGDADTAARHAHSTKGLAGSIAARPLQDAAKVLEEAIRSGEAEPQAALAAYEAALATVIGGIRRAFPNA